MVQGKLMKRKSKIFILILFSLMLVTSFVDNVYAKSKELEIVMVLWRGMTEAEKGFQENMENLGYKVNYTIFNAKQNRSQLAAYLRLKFLPNIENYDYVYSFGTTASQMVKSINEYKVPHIFNIVTDPVKAKIVKTMENPGVNISGVSHKVPLENQIETALSLKKIRKIAFFFNPRESNSLIIKKEMESLSRKYKFDLFEFRTAPVNDMLEQNLLNLEKNQDGIDFVYIPLDSYLTTKSKDIGNCLKKIKIASLGTMKEHVDNGALLGLVPDYYNLGKKAAQVLDRNYRGEPLSQIEVQKEENPKIAINESTRKAIKVKIPRSLLKNAIIIES